MHNVGRGIAPDQERVTVTLKAGWNSLMLGIYQQGGAWGGCARIVDSSDQPIPAIKYAAKPAK